MTWHYDWAFTADAMWALSYCVANKDCKMAKIQGFRVRNFKVLRDVTLGRLWNQQKNIRSPT